MLQENRKPIEGECPICYEDLRIDAEEITYCVSCGGNMHYDCREDCEELRPEEQEEILCPLCRAQWEDPSKYPRTLLPELSGRGFELYFEWIYKGRIVPFSEPDFNDGAIWYTLTKAYVVGITVQDPAFRQAILRSFVEVIERHGNYPRPSTVRFAYEQTSPNSGLRRFLIHIYVTSAEYTWFQGGKWDRFPDDFRQDVFQALIQKRERVPFRDLEVEKYVNDNEDIPA
jgi:hypothetical protein